MSKKKSTLFNRENYDLYIKLVKYLAPYKQRAIIAIIAMIISATAGVSTIALIVPLVDSVIMQEGGKTELTDGDNIENNEASDENNLDNIEKSKKTLFDKFNKAGETKKSSKFISDHLKNMTPAKTLLVISILAVLFTVITQSTSYIQAYLVAYIGNRAMMDVRNQIHRHLLTLSLEFFTSRKTGDLMSRMSNDVQRLRRTIVMVFGDLLNQPILLIWFLGLTLLISWQVSLATFIVSPIVAWPISSFNRRMRLSAKRVTEQYADINSVLYETFSGIRVVKGFNMEEYENERYENESKKLFKASMRVARIRARSKPIMEIIFVFIAVLAIWMWYYVALHWGGLTNGAVAAYLAALASCYKPIRQMTRASFEFQEAMASAERVFYLLDIAPKITDKPDAVELEDFNKEIEFENVTFAYENDNVLKDINFKIKAGQMVAVVGPSGAGKTTLMNLLPRFYDPQKGSIKVDGHDIRDIKQSNLLAQLGIVTQETVLFNDTVRNNIAYGHKEISDEMVIESAKAANAHGFIEELAEGYNTVIGERGVKLSGGQKQRISIARAILKNPRILLLDEATSSLDTESERLVQKALDKLIENKTTLAIAHRLSTIMHADKILVMEKGKIIEEGTHKELLANNGVYKKLYDKQFRTDLDISEMDTRET